MRLIELPLDSDDNPSLSQALATIRSWIASNTEYWYISPGRDTAHYLLTMFSTPANDAIAYTWLGTPANYTALGYTAIPPTWAVTGAAG